MIILVTLIYGATIFTKDSSKISGLSNSASVGTVSATSTSAFTTTYGIEDVRAYWGSDKSTIVIYFPCTIYAPQNCKYLFTIGLTNGSSHRLPKLTTLDLINFNTSKVIYMDGMFYYCTSLTSLDVSNFDTSKVTNMSYMFGYCLSLTSLNLGNFNLTACTSFGSMLSGCYKLTSITLPYNLQSGKTISLPASYYNGSAGPYNTVGTATSGTTVACSTASSKVTLTKK
ncbi:MAG: BspA family leucine-rich repeat surface protein [Christensenellales bacterium]